ncbi:MAG: glutamine amidotransferase, partial [Candidatus Puniceispirillum sp.]|nr:glutamine amidotransferase [Candidatus Puniceispirillum sp.]
MLKWSARMCGIVGLFLKDKNLESDLGTMLTDMLVTMTDRGPDSAGIAIYGQNNSKQGKLTIQSDNPVADFATLANDLSKALGCTVSLVAKDTHAVLHMPATYMVAARNELATINSAIRIMSAGDTIEIYKEVGLPRDVAKRFQIGKMSGSHGIGHTRMATESAVTTMGAHPF